MSGNPFPESKLATLDPGHFNHCAMRLYDIHKAFRHGAMYRGNPPLKHDYKEPAESDLGRMYSGVCLGGPYDGVGRVGDRKYMEVPSIHLSLTREEILRRASTPSPLRHIYEWSPFGAWLYKGVH